eukprot:gene2224-2741_t
MELLNSFSGEIVRSESEFFNSHLQHHNREFLIQLVHADKIEILEYIVRELMNGVELSDFIKLSMVEVLYGYKKGFNRYLKLFSPQDLIQYFKKGRIEKYMYHMDSATFLYLVEECQCVLEPSESMSIMRKALKFGMVSVVDYLYSKFQFNNTADNNSLINHANNLELVQFCHRNFSPVEGCNVETLIRFCRSHSKSVVGFLMKNRPEFRKKEVLKGLLGNNYLKEIEFLVNHQFVTMEELYDPSTRYSRHILTMAISNCTTKSIIEFLWDRFHQKIGTHINYDFDDFDESSSQQADLQLLPVDILMIHRTNTEVLEFLLEKGGIVYSYTLLRNSFFFCRLDLIKVLHNWSVKNQVGTEIIAEPNIQPITMLSQDELMLKSTVSQFATKRIKPLVKQMDEKSYLDEGLRKELFDMSLMGIEIPEKFNGSGLNFMSSIIVIEELAKIDPAISVIVDVQNTLVNNCIMRYGTEEQKQKYLPKLATDTMASFCLSEWSSGSDAFALKTKAEKKGDHYVLNGTKAWITNSKEAGVFIVMANVDPSQGYKGITAFIVDRDTPGLEIGKKEDKLGIRASSTCEVIFNDVAVPASNILGQLGRGYKIAIEGLNEGRIGIAAQMIGLAQGAFDSTMPYLIDRKQFGKSIGEFQGMQFTYADLAVDIEAGKLLTYNAARLQEAGQPFVTEASMAKLYCSKVAEKVSSACISMLGGVGYTKEFDAEKYFRDCKVGQIYG